MGWRTPLKSGPDLQRWVGAATAAVGSPRRPLQMRDASLRLPEHMEPMRCLMSGVRGGKGVQSISWALGSVPPRSGINKEDVGDWAPAAL